MENKINYKCIDCKKEIKGFGIRCKSCCQKGERNYFFGKKKSEEFKNNIRLVNLGIKQSNDWIKKRVESKKGFKHSEESRKKISIANIGKKSFLGKNHSEETKKKISLSHKGKHLISSSSFKKGHIWKEGIKQKMINTMKEKFNTPEFKLKMGNRIINYPTSIEIKIQNFLKELKVGFFTHYYCKEIEHSYQCDIFIPVQRSRDFFIKQPIIIECDGDYWHCNPNKYKKDYIRFKTDKKFRTAQEVWDRDKLRTQELENKGYKVLRIWESDINNLNINQFSNKIL
jgi:G:T-mismatch repair DNA endonuclease (very short patch repair protein)